jgi:hypothetical protein
MDEPNNPTHLAHVRQELHLPFDRERFEAGIVDSNARMFTELEKIMGPLD